MKSKRILLAVAFIGFAVVCFMLLGEADKEQKVDKLEIQGKTIDLKTHELKGAELQEKLEVELNKDTKDQEKIKQLEQENRQFQEETKELQRQLQVKRDSKAKLAASKALNTVTGTQKVSAAPQTSGGATKGNCGDNMYKQYIYQKESNCNTAAVNSIGCRGIGQACPGSKLPCGNDFACQDAWFSNYAQQRYGGWKGAYNFWLQNHWW